MNNTKLKKQAREALQKGLVEADSEANGVWSLEVYDTKALPEILVGAALGIEEFVRLSEIFVAISKKIVRPPIPNEPLLCLTCDRGFTPTTPPPRAIVVLKGYNPSAKHLIINVLCERCSGRTDSKQRVMEAIRKGVIHDLREITIGEAGRA